METLSVRWIRPTGHVAAEICIHVETPEDASRVWNMLAAILKGVADLKPVRRPRHAGDGQG